MAPAGHNEPPSEREDLREGSPQIRDRGGQVPDDGTWQPLDPLPAQDFWRVLYTRRSIRRFTEDPVQTALLIAATETLEGFASGLAEMSPEPEGLAPLPDISHRRGKLDLPVDAEILLYPGETDASGVTRPGLMLATRANMLVSSPVAATIRYRGPLLDLGNVIVLEPQSGLLFVFAGLGSVFGEVGEVIPTGAPLGLMGGNDPKIDAILSQSGEGSGQDRTETLYIEVRDGKTPVNPGEWFRINKDG